MGILNSSVRRNPGGRWLAVLFLFAGGGTLFAGESRHPVFAARAGAEYHRAQTQFQLHTNDPAAAWQFARACFEFNDFVTNNAGRAELAGQGIAACRQLLARESNSAPGHYYLAIELGLLADTKRNLAAIKMVREMEREFKTAGNLDEHFDYAGPARCLGLLHRDAPGWPMSIGSRHKAREWLEQAAKLAPDYPENRLNLVESYWQWKDHEAARAELKTLDALWPRAQTNFTGEAWERSWDDWSTRRDAAREKLNEIPAPAKPPKNSGHTLIPPPERRIHPAATRAVRLPAG
jgi:tetratricopeptide (TPR) repeat protein